MAKAAKKKQAPSKPCPKCGKPIHARKQSHEECGWVATPSEPKASKTPNGRKTKGGRKASNGRLDFPFGATAGKAGDLASDIRALRAIKARLGSEVIRELLEL